MRIPCVALSTVCLTQAGPAQTTDARRLVDQVDHVMFVTGEHRRVISLLTDTLSLPLVWPTPTNPWQASSGIAIGNVNLEMMHSNREVPFLSSLALQAGSWKSLLDDLRSRNIAMLEPGVGPIDSTRADRLPRWNVQAVTGFGRGIFFVQYNHFDMAERRRAFAEELQQRKGGRLGVVRLREIVVRVDTVANRVTMWDRLFGGRDGDAPTWIVGNGPRLTLVHHEHARADDLVVEVASVAAARLALDSLRISYREEDAGIRLDAARFGGLRLVLVAREPQREQ